MRYYSCLVMWPNKAAEREPADGISQGRGVGTRQGYSAAGITYPPFAILPRTLTLCNWGVTMVSKSRVTVTALALACVGLLAGIVSPAGAQTGTWTQLAHPFPGNGSTANPALGSGFKGPGIAQFFTDGSVIVHDACTPSWFRLLPDNTGSYINGQWSATAIGDNAALAAMIGTGTVADNYGPLHFSSAVLPDGRFIVNGGEGDNSVPGNNCTTAPATDSNKGSLFNPQANSWTSVPPPAGWVNIGDAANVVLGVNNLTGIYSVANYMLQNGVGSFNINLQSAIATIAPLPGTTLTWTILSSPANGKADTNNEEGWTLLPNGQVLTVDVNPCAAAPGVCAPTNAEVFNPSLGKWSNAGNTPTTLVSQTPQQELGPAVGIGYDMVVQFGAVNAIALYSYNPAGPGTWAPQTGWPSAQAVPDGPASLLPNGNILVQTNVAGGFNKPSLFWEFNSSILTPQNLGPAAPISTVNVPPCQSANTTNVAAYQGHMLLLPTGQVFWDAGLGGNCTAIYTTTTPGNPNSTMRPPPHINSVSSTTLTRGNTFTLTGSMFRGVSQGAAYGDDAQAATNYPLVMIKNNATGHICWGRTHNWGLQTSTQFDVPPAVTPAPGWALVENPCETGASTLVVVVNGLVSNTAAVTVN
jgi:hypothetical protein